MNHAPRTPGGDGRLSLREDGLLGLLAALLRYWRSILAITLGGTALAVLISFLVAPTYRAATVIVPSGSVAGESGLAVPGALLGAARSLGVGLGGSASDPSALFPRILRSRTFADRLLARSVPDRDGGERALLAVLAGEGGTDAARGHAARRALRDEVLRSHHDVKSGVTSLTVTLRDPVTAAAAANAAVEELDALNREAKAAHAARWVEFIGERLAEAEGRLAASEDSLRAFHQQNRRYAESPLLSLEEGRLRREVAMDQELYATLRTQHELARAEEVKTVPAITVLDPARPPLERHSPYRARIAVTAFILLLLGGCCLALIRASVTEFRRRPAYRALRREVGRGA